MPRDLSLEEAASLLDYNPDTGLFTRIKKIKYAKHETGSVAGCKSGNGYIIINLLGVNYQAHRLAFLYMIGRMPKQCVDHINGNGEDNRWCNLREATRRENNLNRIVPSTSGEKGVSKCIQTGLWKVSVFSGGRYHWGGRHIDLEQARQKACSLRNILHGSFANHNTTSKKEQVYHS